MKNDLPHEDTKNAKPLMNPYIAGVFLGLTLLASYLILGAGLGASGGIARLGAYFEGLIASSHTMNSAYFGKWGTNPLYYYLVFMFAGILIGGFFSALAGRRVKLGLIKGKKNFKDTAYYYGAHRRNNFRFRVPARQRMHFRAGFIGWSHAAFGKYGIHALYVYRRLCGGLVRKEAVG